MVSNDTNNALEAKAKVEEMLKSPKDVKEALQAGEQAVSKGQITSIREVDEKSIVSSLPAKEETKQIGR